MSVLIGFARFFHSPPLAWLHEIASVTVIVRLSTDWADFTKKLDYAHPILDKTPLTILWGDDTGRGYKWCRTLSEENIFDEWYSFSVILVTWDGRCASLTKCVTGI